MKSVMVDNVKDAPEKVAGWWERTNTFFKEVRSEMKRVSWPTRKEVYATTVVVVLTSIFFGVYLWGVDLVFNSIVGWIFRELGA